MITQFDKLIPRLVQEGVQFIIVGGAAATAHGSARLTLDLDIVYRRTKGNIELLITALRPYDPYLRGAPPGLPFAWDEETIWAGLNFTLVTSLGAIDILGEITGGGTFEALLPDAIPVELYGVRALCLGLRRLIQVKRAAGRIKDLEAIAELEAILEEGKKT